MKLQEKFSKARLNTQFDSGIRFEIECEKIAEDFAIGFWEWRSTTVIKSIDQYTNKEVVEIYKKHKS